MQRDKLIEERREAITILGGRYNVNMVDLAVERIVHQWVKDMLECKQKIGDLDRRIREISNDIKTLKMIGPYQIKRRERTIEELENQLEKKIFQVRLCQARNKSLSPPILGLFKGYVIIVRSSCPPFLVCCFHQK